MVEVVVVVSSSSLLLLLLLLLFFVVVVTAAMVCHGVNGNARSQSIQESVVMVASIPYGTTSCAPAYVSPDFQGLGKSVDQGRAASIKKVIAHFLSRQ